MSSGSGLPEIRHQTDEEWSEHLKKVQKQLSTPASMSSMRELVVQTPYKPWEEIAAELNELYPYQSPEQCQMQWDNLWSADDDKYLHDQKLNSHLSFAQIKTHFPDKDQNEVQARWDRDLAPNEPSRATKPDPWTEAEDSKLKELRDEKGMTWAQIAREMENRSESACRRHYDHIKWKEERGEASRT